MKYPDALAVRLREMIFHAVREHNNAMGDNAVYRVESTDDGEKIIIA